MNSNFVSAKRESSNLPSEALAQGGVNLAGLGVWEPGQRFLTLIGPPYMKGEDVKFVQRVVGVTADGLYGPQTKAAVAQFQREHGLAVNGAVTVENGTWAALKNAESGFSLGGSIRSAWALLTGNAVNNALDIDPKFWDDNGDDSTDKNPDKKSNRLFWWLGGGAVGVSLLALVMAQKDE